MKAFLILMLALLSAQCWAQSPQGCVNIYYDKSPDPTYNAGKIYATFLQNLLGHFPELQQRLSPIEFYKSGDIEECRATIYLGSYFPTVIPEDFLNEFTTTKKQVAWLGYGIWQLNERFENVFGYKYQTLTKLNQTQLTHDLLPTFYKDVLYKGEVFSKYGAYSKVDPTQFLAGFEVAALGPVTPSRSEVLAQIRHNGTGDILPYALRAQNHFYVADIPFSFMHERDRYLVFADLLFDILNLPPRHNGKYALVRLEDIHPMISLPELYKVTGALEKEQVPYQISLIPIFTDPLNEYHLNPKDEMVSMDRVPEFMTFIREMQQKHTNFIWHGVTHQYGKIKNPHNGASGDDFEFWDAINSRPLGEDSVPFVLNRMEEGLYTLRKAGVAPRIWMTPHYQSSSLDNIIFGKIFEWNIGRMIYFDYRASGLPTSFTKSLSSLWMTSLDTQAANERLNYFKDLKVEYLNPKWNGQLFPYEIYGDVHGQRLLPENLGNCQPYVSEHVINPRSYNDIIEDARRNRVLRDTWASFFYHTSLVNTYEDGGRGHFPGDTNEITAIVKKLKEFGYTFVDINDFMDKNKGVLRPEPLIRCLINEPFSQQCKGN